MPPPRRHTSIGTVSLPASSRYVGLNFSSLRRNWFSKFTFTFHVDRLLQQKNRYVNPHHIVAKFNQLCPGDLDIWPLTFHCDLQTRPSEGPNTFSVWIWRKSVQQFPKYFIHKQKTTDWRRQKQNLPQFTACGKSHRQRKNRTLVVRGKKKPYCSKE